MIQPVRVLSGRQPWQWCMTSLPPPHRKALENRRRKDGLMPTICRHRGPLLLHASEGCTRDYYAGAVAWIAEHVGADVAAMVPPLRELPRGGIVGRALVVAHIEPTGATRTHPTEPDSAGPYADRFPLGIDFRWHMDESYALVLVDAEPLPFLPCSGGLTLWKPPCAFNRNGAHKEAATHYRRDALLCQEHAAGLDEADPRPTKSALLVPERWALSPAGL